MSELDAFLDDSNDIISSFSSGFIHSLSILSDNSKSQLTASIKSYKIWCKARALPSTMTLSIKVSASKLIVISSHTAAFGFKDSS